MIQISGRFGTITTEGSFPITDAFIMPETGISTGDYIVKIDVYNREGMYYNSIAYLGIVTD